MCMKSTLRSEMLCDMQQHYAAAAMAAHSVQDDLNIRFGKASAYHKFFG